jgi:hypothetical protein
VAWRKQGVGWHLSGLVCSCRQHPDSIDVLAEKRRLPNRRYISSEGVRLLGAVRRMNESAGGVAEVIDNLGAVDWLGVSTRPSWPSTGLVGGARGDIPSE